MKIILKTLKYYGEQTEVHDHDMYGKVFLFPKGTQREVKVLQIPSFKIVNLRQEAKIEEGYTPNDGIKYAYNSWIYVTDTLRQRIFRSEVVYLDNVLVKKRHGKDVRNIGVDVLINAEMELWDEKKKTLFLKSK
jgi:hypothetical protein